MQTHVDSVFSYCDSTIPLRSGQAQGSLPRPTKGNECYTADVSWLTLTADTAVALESAIRGHIPSRYLEARSAFVDTRTREAHVSMIKHVFKIRLYTANGQYLHTTYLRIGRPAVTVFART